MSVPPASAQARNAVLFGLVAAVVTLVILWLTGVLRQSAWYWLIPLIVFAVATTIGLSPIGRRRGVE